MKDIVIVANFTVVPGEKGNSRFDYLASQLSKTGEFNVELVSSNFSHSKKNKRYVTEESMKKLNYKLTLLKEFGYKKNVSIFRFYSHYTLSKSISKYLKSRKKPDIVYCAIPSLEVGNVLVKYCKKNNIKFIIDIQDLWPEAFKMVFNIPIISDVIFYPMEKIANKIYTNADKVIAVSDTYRDRAISVNKKELRGLTVFLGTDLSYFDKIVTDSRKFKKDDEFWITYIGTLGHSYDIKTVIDALKIVNNYGIYDIKFMVIGDGPLKEEFEKYSNLKNVNVEFTGRMNYEKMVELIVQSDIAVNPIVKGAAQSIVNKVGDYAAAGLPVLNTQECIEYRNLIDEYNCGINCINNNAEDLAKGIITLYNDKDLRVTMGKNNRKLAVEKFDRKINYKKIIEFIKD